MQMLEAVKGPLSEEELALIAPVLAGSLKSDREWDLYQLLSHHLVPWRYARQSLLPHMMVQCVLCVLDSLLSSASGACCRALAQFASM